MASSTGTADEGDGVPAFLRMSLIDRLIANESSLTELAGFGRHTVEEISSALVKNTTVNSLKFNSCELGDDDCEIVMKALTQRYVHQTNHLCVTCRPRTKRISFARNHIGAAGAIEIAKFLSYPSTECNREQDSELPMYIKSNSQCDQCGNDRLLSPRFLEDFIRLDLLANEVGDEGVSAICDIIASCETDSCSRSHRIVELGCERNGISDFGMIGVSQMLKTNYSLRALHLGRNVITYEGMVYLAEAIKHNKTLEVLNLTGNNSIGDEGAMVLADSLKFNTTLKTCLLKKCGITDYGCNHLLQALYDETSPHDVVNSSNHTLTEVSVCTTYACNHVDTMNTISIRTVLSWNNLGAATAQRLKLGNYLRSKSGIKYVHSLGLDRKLFPTLLCRLWKVFRDNYYLSRRSTNKLDVVWSYIRGMPELVENQT